MTSYSSRLGKGARGEGKYAFVRIPERVLRLFRLYEELLV
jgi:hypothetical protein